MRRRRVRSSRGNHAAAITSSCAPTSTESEGRITDSATRSLRPGGGAEASSPRASGLSAAAGPTAALSTMIEIGSVATVRAPWRARTAPITSVPARPIAPGLHLLLSDRAENLLGLRLAQSPGRGGARRATPPLPGLRRCATTAPSPRGRRVVPGAAAPTPHRQLEVPFGGEVTGVEHQSFAIGALGLGQVRVTVYGVGAGHSQRQQAEIVQRAEP